MPKRLVGLILHFVLSWRSCAAPTVTVSSVARRLRLTAVKRKRLATLDTVTVGAGHDPSSVCLFVNRSTSKRALISPSLSVNCFLISRPSLILELPTNSRMQSFIDTAEPSGKLMEPLKLSVVNNCYARLTNAGSVNVASWSTGVTRNGSWWEGGGAKNWMIRALVSAWRSDFWAALLIWLSLEDDDDKLTVWRTRTITEKP